MNFHGFYTVLLERNEELISAATVRWVWDLYCATTSLCLVDDCYLKSWTTSTYPVSCLFVNSFRVYGKKVAELPLIGTRLQYRRHGMCRILMNELEKVSHKAPTFPLPPVFSSPPFIAKPLLFVRKHYNILSYDWLCHLNWK